MAVPLTIEQLREMDGQPVWVTPTGFWALVIAKKEKRVELICNDGETVYADKYIELVGPVYACPPTHIDREAWGCELCKDAKFVSGIAYSEKQVDKDRACAVSFSDEGADCDFYYCPNCGKPLTPEAWAELEKRLGGG